MAGDLSHLKYLAIVENDASMRIFSEYLDEIRSDGNGDVVPEFLYHNLRDELKPRADDTKYACVFFIFDLHTCSDLGLWKPFAEKGAPISKYLSRLREIYRRDLVDLRGGVHVIATFISPLDVRRRLWPHPYCKRNRMTEHNDEFVTNAHVHDIEDSFRLSPICSVILLDIRGPGKLDDVPECHHLMKERNTIKGAKKAFLDFGSTLIDEGGDESYYTLLLNFKFIGLCVSSDSMVPRPLISRSVAVMNVRSTDSSFNIMASVMFETIMERKLQKERLAFTSSVVASKRSVHSDPAYVSIKIDDSMMTIPVVTHDTISDLYDVYDEEEAARGNVLHEDEHGSFRTDGDTEDGFRRDTKISIREVESLVIEDTLMSSSELKFDVYIGNDPNQPSVTDEEGEPFRILVDMAKLSFSELCDHIIKESRLVKDGKHSTNITVPPEPVLPAVWRDTQDFFASGVNALCLYWNVKERFHAKQMGEQEEGFPYNMETYMMNMGGVKLLTRKYGENFVQAILDEDKRLLPGFHASKGQIDAFVARFNGQIFH